MRACASVGGVTRREEIWHGCGVHKNMRSWWQEPVRGACHSDPTGPVLFLVPHAPHVSQTAGEVASVLSIKVMHSETCSLAHRTRSQHMLQRDCACTDVHPHGVYGVSTAGCGPITLSTARTMRSGASSAGTAPHLPVASLP